MKKLILLILISLSLNACYRLPQREEIEYRNTLENAIVNTFPKKVVVVIHPFQNLSKGDTNRAYLEDAIPDNIEAMLESLRSTLAYIPFDGMPFYVSSELSNLFQNVDIEDDEDDEGNFDEFGVNTNENDDEDEDEDETNSIFDNTNSIFDDEDDDDGDTNDDRFDDSYFTYLTNYLLVVPTQETQYRAKTTTNTNYYKFITNTEFVTGVLETNITSNEILRTTTNAIRTNLIIVNKNLLTPTNMLIMLYEEFPTLTNYLSFLPIEVRRATPTDITAFADYKLKLSDPTQWKANQNKKTLLEKQEKEKAAKDALEKEEAEAKERGEEIVKTPATDSKGIDFALEEKKEIEPTTPFEYVYHIGGDFRTRRSESIVTAVTTSIRLQIYPAYSSGDVWWEKNFSSMPPVLSKILRLEESLDPTDKESFKTVFLRTPFEKPDISPRLQDEFDAFSTNFRDSRPPNPTNKLRKRTRPLNLRISVPENQIPIAMNDWLKYFHSIIINRPYTALRVTSNPSGSLVYLNGFFIGSTPLVYPTAPLGEQRVLFLKEGFNREEILTEIIPNQTNSIAYTLQALNNSGTLSVMASIPDAEVYLNAQYKGKTPLIISNLTLYNKYRVEILDPSATLSSNRNSVYKSVTLTDKKKSMSIDAKFKTYETSYRTPAQKGLLAATYISWFTTIGLLGASFYTQARSKEAEDLINAFGTPTSEAQQDQLNKYTTDRDRYALTSQATLYSAIGAALLSTGIMSWYLYSKEVYLGMEVDPEKKEWYANFKLKF